MACRIEQSPICPQHVDPIRLGGALNSPQSFAVIPAAGRSRRMGDQQKLLLPWRGTTLIEQVLRAWLESRIDRIVLVSRRDDHELHRVVRRYPSIELVLPEEDPSEMKRSVWIGLQHLQSTQPTDRDRWLLAPADMPTLTHTLIDQIIERGWKSSAIVYPKFDQRRGHPVSFPWSFAKQVGQLGTNEGINCLLERFPCESLSIDTEPYPADVDTEADYHRLLSDPRAD